MNKTTSCQCWAKLGLSLVTSPLLLGLIVFQSLTQTLMEWGEVSEEIFRGDRLPILPFPEDDREDQLPNSPQDR